MKRKLFLMFGMMALLVSCHSDVDELNINNPRSYAIRLDGEITRTDANGFCDGDKIGLYGVNYTNNNATQGTLLDEGNQVDNARYTYNKELGEWQSSGSIYYKDAETNIDLYAYYPYGSPENVNDYIFEVAKDQSGNDAVDGYAASDFLWGKTENITPSEDRVKIRFSHRLSRANVVLTEGSGFGEGEFNTLEKSVLVNNTIRTASIDLATGDAITAGEVEPEGIVMRATDDGWSAIVVPQSVGAGEALLAITIDGIVYRFKRGEAFTYEPGKQHTFTITVNKKSMTGSYEFILTDCEIVDWIADLEAHGGEARQYYVVHLDEAGTLGAKLREAKKNPNKIKNLKVSGKICTADFYFMRDSMEILQAINLKESKILKGRCLFFDILDGNGTRIIAVSEHIGTSYDQVAYIVKKMFPNWNPANGLSYDIQDFHEDEIPSNAFYKGYETTSLVHFVFPEKVTKICSYAFRNTLLSGALIIPDDVIEIEEEAFANTNISSLRLPYNLKKIGNYAFAYCNSLSGALSLPETLESIGEGAFTYCNLLSGNLNIPSKITEIPHNCFSNCQFSGDLTIGENVTKILSHAFSGNNFGGHLTLPHGLKVIAQSAFQNCSFQGELIIPSRVQIIDDYCFYGNAFSSIIFAENSELIQIEDSAFRDNTRLSEPVILPDGTMTIESNAFWGCGNLPAITIPKDVTTIGANAFRECYYLTSIKCDATIPPVIGGGAFDGVGKDNLTLQVPEDAVARYQTANGWSEFKRISANYDFSISRKHIRALNAEYSKTYLLRAPSGEPWSVESCPDWVTVTPSSGVGREEVTVTISEMARTDATFTREEWNGGQWNSGYYTETHKGRAGEIVFKLDNKTTSNDEPVTVKMTAEQYDCDYADGDVIVNQTASQGAGVNIVFMGDCFDARDIAMGSYKAGIDEAIAYYFGIEPYKTYKPYFNIYTVVGMSPDSGMGTVNTIRDAKFGSQYSLDGIAPDTQTTYEYAMKATTVNESNLNQTLVVMVENTTDYGGICYMWGDGSAIAVCPMSRDAYPFDFRGIVQHEAGGHGFAKLADEYIYHNGFIESCCPAILANFYAGKALGWYRNLSTNGDYKSVEWAHLFANPDYSNVVDMYEGGYFHTRGIFRSEATSCMNNNIPYYSAISRQEMVERIKRYAGEEFSLAEFYAKDVRDASNNDFVTRSLEVEDNATTRAAAAKQMAPKFMGDKPQLKK